MDPSQQQQQQHQHSRQNQQQRPHQQYNTSGLAYNAPTHSNAPPHIFGSYSAENSPTTASVHGASHLGDSYGYDDDDDRGADQGQGDPKRRRIARACDMCRKKKIKCDGKTPRCSHCENYKTECIFTQVEKKRNPPKGAKYIEGLENRLGRMEALLRLSGLLGEDDSGKTDLGTLEKRLADKQAAGSSGVVSTMGSPVSPATQHQLGDGSGPVHHSPPITGVTSPNTAAPTPDTSNGNQLNPKQVEALADQMCSLVTNNCGETRYIGSSSGFSIFSPKGIQWVNDKTGDTSFHDMISQAAADDKHWAHWKPEVFADIFQRKTYRALPPKQEAMALLKDFFENFNSMFPLFHEPTFMHLVDRHYSLEPYEGSGWWASLNVALAIAHRLRVMSDVHSRDEDEKAWGYLKNALAVQTELTLRNNDLLSVQALLGLAMFMQGTPNPQPGFFLLAAALRLAHSIGLHKRGSDFNLNDVETEQRKRVFWIAYIMDKDICLRSGRPPIQDDDDMNVDLPSDNPPDNIGNVVLADGKGKINLFRLQCIFATIQSKVYKQLYSVRASRQSDGELLNTIGELDQELEAWKDSIPVDFRPEHEIKVSHAALTLHVVTLHFAYYNCLTTIHRMSVHHGYWTSRLSDYAIAGLNARPLNPRVFMSAALCVNAARTSISLVKYIPKGDHACVWLILYYPVSALVTLFANILQNPQDARARSDLKLMHSVCQYLSELCQADSNIHCRRMYSICSEFERIARVALEKAEREMRGRGKRKASEKDKDEAEATSKTDAPPPQQQPQQAPQSQYSKHAQRSSNSYPPPQQPMRQQSVPPKSSMQPPQFPATRTPNMSSSYLPRSNSNGNSPATLMPNGAQVDSPYGQSSFSNVPFSPSSQSSYAMNGDVNDGSRFGQSRPPANMGPFSQAPAMLPSSLFPPDGMGGGGGGGMGDFNWNNNDVAMSGSFQQPFVPQDLWQMPMTLEWDWADVLNTSSNLTFDDMASFGDGTGNNNQQHQQQQQQ